MVEADMVGMARDAVIIESHDLIIRSPKVQPSL